MKPSALDLLACPICHECLDYASPDEKTLHTGLLICSRCKNEYPIVDGIPHFIQPEALTGLNRRIARMHDWNAGQRRRGVLMGPGILATWLKAIATDFPDWLTFKVFLEPMIRRAQAGTSEV